MPIDEAILYFCEECHTVSLQGGVCANCENLLQVDFFVPKAELEALRSALAEREARIAEWKAITEHLVAVIGNANLADSFLPHVVKLLIYIDEKELADNLSVTGFASTNESEKK